MNTETKSVSHMDPVAECIFAYKSEAEIAKQKRMAQNKENFDAYHLRQDYSHKQQGQSQEFLAKQSMAVEQVTTFLQQGLMDQGDWFRINAAPGIDKPLIEPKEMERILLRQLNKNKFALYIEDALKLGLLAALMVAKVGGKMVTKSTFKTDSAGWWSGGKKKLKRTDKEVWQLDLSLVRQEDYFPDPTGRGLYEVQRIEMDHFELLDLAKKNPDEGFNLEAIRAMTQSSDDLQGNKKSRETDQNQTTSGYRKVVTLLEQWGTLLHPYTGEVMHRNCVSAIDLNGNVIRSPQKNPLWHGKSPFVVSPIMRVPHSVWHKAMMDAATKHNIALNELYNLMLDAGMMSVYGIKQVRTSWLQNPSQISGGIPPGITLQVNSSCPPGEDVLKRVDTSALSSDSIQMFNITDREFQQSAMTNDTRLGTLPQRAVKATEVVASNQTITGIFNGMVKVIEEEFIDKVLERSWETMAQHMNDLDDDEVKAIVGKDRALIFSNTPNEEIFAATAQGHVFETFGLSQTLNKIQDFRKIQALLQSIGTSPLMMQEFQRAYSMTKLLGEVIKSLDIDETKIKMTEIEKQQLQQEQAAQMQAMAQAEGGKGNTMDARGSNPQSQIPQAMNQAAESGISPPRASLNQGMTAP